MGDIIIFHGMIGEQKNGSPEKGVLRGPDVSMDGREEARPPLGRVLRTGGLSTGLIISQPIPPLQAEIDIFFQKLHISAVYVNKTTYFLTSFLS